MFGSFATDVNAGFVFKVSIFLLIKYENKKDLLEKKKI